MTWNLTTSAAVEAATPVAWIGPVAVLAALLFSLAAQRVWDRLIGEASCRWRLPYFPDARVYAIWALIYATTVAAVVLQLLAPALPDALAVLDWATNLGWAGAWLCAGAWVIAFDREDGCNFWLAALLLAAGAGSGVAALAVEEAWHRAPASPVRAAAIATTTPLALLAGWMLVACALNVGIAVRASGGGPPDIDCPARLRARRLRGRTARQTARAVWASLRRQDDARAPLRERTAWGQLPLVLLALVAAGLAFAVREPLLPAPTLLATLLQRGLRCPPRWTEAAALLLVAAGATLAALRIATFSF